jgi:hypothetical protein
MFSSFATNDSIGEGLEYNNKLIEDPGATLTRIVTRCRLSHPPQNTICGFCLTKAWLLLILSKEKSKEKKGRKIKRPTVMTVKITDKGYKYLEERQGAADHFLVNK